MKKKEQIEKTAAGICWNDFPEASRQTFCESFLAMTAEAFKRPKVRKDFEEWKKKRDATGGQSDRQSASDVLILSGGGSE